MGPNSIFFIQNLRGDVPDGATPVKQERLWVFVFQIGCEPKIDLANLVILPHIFRSQFSDLHIKVSFPEHQIAGLNIPMCIFKRMEILQS